MKKHLHFNWAAMFAGIFGLFLFCLPQGELTAQCPSDYQIIVEFNDTNSDCYNRGTVDPLDDVRCLSGIELTIVGQTPTDFAQVSINGTNVGAFNITDPVLEFFETRCLPLNNSPWQIEFQFSDGCVISFPESGTTLSNCSDCDDADGDGICDDVDTCPGFDDSSACNSAPCPPLSAGVFPADAACDDNGTSDPSDDIICFSVLQFAGADLALISSQVNLTFAGIDLGLQTPNTPIFLDEPQCFSATLDPIETIIEFEGGCVKSTLFSGFAFPTCSTCNDIDSDGVCDDVDQCLDTESGAVVNEDGCTGCPDGDNDGICDDADSCPSTLPGAVVNEDGCDPCRIISLYFDVIDDEYTCDNQGTTSSADDDICFSSLSLYTDGLQYLPDLQDINFTIAGQDVGTYSFDLSGSISGPLQLDATYCFVNDGSLEIVSTFSFGCVETNQINGISCPICPDGDNDGICDDVDICPSGDDGIDTDGDGVPDACDVCAGSDDNIDTDGDGVPEGCDFCAGSDDNIDTDGDGVPDACDVCAGSDDNIDTDGDGVPSGCDVCAGSDDNIDTDGDGVPDACDVCAGSDDNIDTDGDGVADGCDACAGSDDNIDTDGDGVADGCDACPALANLNPGDACPSDGDDCTDDGVLSDTCECTSTPIDSPECNPNQECEVCDSSGSNTCYEYIKKVSFGCESNWSGDNGGYGDFTNTPWDMYCGYWYGLSLKPGFHTCAYWENWNIWIDWNQDCDFDDADEHIGQACHWSTVYGYVNVPDHALEGNATMRISMGYEGYADSCDSFEYGEVEDYTINVICGNGLAANNTLPVAYAKRLQDSQAAFELEESQSDMLRPGYIGGNVDRLQLSTFVQDLEAADQIVVYPNPATDVVNISISTDKEVDSIQIFDALGKVVYQVAFNTADAVVTVDVSDFSSGMYSVVVEGRAESLQTTRFVVTR